MTRQLFLAVAVGVAAWTQSPVCADEHIVKYHVQKDGIGGEVVGRWVERGQSPDTERTGSILARRVRVVRNIPRVLVEGEQPSSDRIVELRASSAAALDAEIRRLGLREAPASPPSVDSAATDEVITLVESGPPANRIDLVFMGDGYTVDQREQFLSDIRRMVHEMFESVTFRSYLPLFNVHAVFRPSKEEGIGLNDTPKNTAFGLYREGNTLRAIFPGNPGAARSACHKAPGCDYPVIIANDDYYGGLGGEFAISTRSTTSGSMVLRHELGHNFGEVGEEYDGGGYFGANVSFARTHVKWKHWLSESPAVAQPAHARLVDWPWIPLFEKDATFEFNIAGSSRVDIHLSASGFAHDGDLVMSLDRSTEPVPSRGHSDRSFQVLSFPSLAPGHHTLRFFQEDDELQGWLSNLAVYEYDAAYRWDPGFVGLFPLFSREGTLEAFRSTHDQCLMRNMMSEHFCPICQENNWHKLLGAVRLIDSLSSKIELNDQVTVTLAAIDLRKTQSGTLKVRWFHHDQHRPHLDDMTSWSLPLGEAQGLWRAQVQLVSPEVRVDPDGTTQDERSITIQ